MSTDLGVIEAALKAATPGPWHSWDRGIGYEVHVGSECLDNCCEELNDQFRETFRKADARLIALLRNTAVELVERVKAAEGERDALKERMAEWINASSTVVAAKNCHVEVREFDR